LGLQIDYLQKFQFFTFSEQKILALNRGSLRLAYSIFNLILKFRARIMFSGEITGIVIFRNTSLLHRGLNNSQIIFNNTTTAAFDNTRRNMALTLS
jgi:hypothetical protein